MQSLIQQIKINGISSDLIKEMIDQHNNDRKRMIKQYERYKAEVGGVPILSRKPVEYENFETGTFKRIDNKVNNKLNNAFDAEIVDTKVGYMFGHAISYEIDAEDDEESDKETPLQTEVGVFNMRNNLEDEDSEWGKRAAICGYGARLAYIDPEGNERVRNVNPWEVYILSERNIAEPTYGLRYYSIGKEDQGDLYQADFYDEDGIYEFRQKSAGGNFELVDISEHLFDHCPLFGLPNNDELKGDAEKVYNLIDAYDRSLSDANNEVEQYRLAYLVLTGMVADDEAMDEANRRGILELMDDKEKVHYLTKEINDQMIENHLDRAEENILRFSKSVNFSDESFGTSVTGVAMKYKLMALENKCITMERKMTTALRYQFKVLCSAWAKRGKCKPEDYLAFTFQFTRNLPVNILEEAQTQMALKGNVSERTRLSLLSFIDDVMDEIKRMEVENEGELDLDDDLGGDDGGDEGGTE
ncbi:phage portal protein [Salipaludibacillus sp. CF4.18]|uniref:phage portal protein n=1 Tax=Salipaludibacillus sp. CF4.18 TaxID=3373081 RepID=UPI003EE532F4